MKRINIKKIFLLFIMMLPQIVLAEDYAYRGKEAKVVYIIGVVLLAIRIAVPILLIVLASIDLLKALTSSDEKDTKKILTGIIPKVIISIAILLLPTLLLLILKLTNNTGLFSEYSKCLLRPTSCSVQMFEEPPEIEETSSRDHIVIDQPEIVTSDEDSIGDKLEIVDVSISDTVVNISSKRANSKIAGYYFSSIEKEPDVNGYDWIPSSSTSFRTVKYPGTYYVYVKDEEGTIAGGKEVVVSSDFDVTLMHKGKKLMPKFETYLSKNGSSIYELNKEIASYNVKYGMRTRESVVVGAMAFTSKVQSWGYYMPYSGSNEAIAKDSWGVKPNWGGGEKTFLACNPFVVWSFKNAGLNIYGNWSLIRKNFTRTVRITSAGLTEFELLVRPEGYTSDVHIYRYFVGVLASKNSYGDNIIERHRGRSGDVLQSYPSSGHEMLIVDKYDDDMDGVSDGYIVLQSRDIGLCYQKVKYGSTTVYDMANVYNNTANYAAYLNGWQSYVIPESDYPDYLKELLR